MFACLLTLRTRPKTPSSFSVSRKPSRNAFGRLIFGLFLRNSNHLKKCQAVDLHLGIWGVVLPV